MEKVLDTQNVPVTMKQSLKSLAFQAKVPGGAIKGSWESEECNEPNHLCEESRRPRSPDSAVFHRGVRAADHHAAADHGSDARKPCHRLRAYRTGRLDEA